MPSPTDAPVSLPERLADAEGELPEEIVKAIEDLQRWAILLGGLTAGAVFKVQEVRAALTATILGRLTDAESAREAAVAERDAFRDKLAEMFGQLMLAEGSASKLRAEREAAGREALSREKAG